MVGNRVLVLRKSRYRFWMLKVQNGQPRMRILAPEVAKKQCFLVIFRPFMCEMTSNLVWKAYEVCIYVCYKGFGWKCVVRDFYGFYKWNCMPILSLFFSGNADFLFFFDFWGFSWLLGMFRVPQTSCIPVSTSKEDLILVGRSVSRFPSTRSCQMKMAESAFWHFCPVKEVKIGVLVIFRWLLGRLCA